MAIVFFGLVTPIVYFFGHNELPSMAEAKAISIEEVEEYTRDRCDLKVTVVKTDARLEASDFRGETTTFYRIDQIAEYKGQSYEISTRVHEDHKLFGFTFHDVAFLGGALGCRKLKR